MVCPGNAMSVSHERLLLLKNSTVNRNLGFNDVCNEKHVIVAYNNLPQVFEVSINRSREFLGIYIHVVIIDQVFLQKQHSRQRRECYCE